MLIKLLPEQVSKYWVELRPAIEKALPPTGDANRMQNVLSSILMDRLKVWASFYEKDGKRVFNGVVTTAIEDELGTSNRALLIYSVFGYSDSSPKDWFAGLETIKKYALAEGCTHIKAYSNIDNVVAMAARLGADTSYRLILFSL